MEIIDNISRLLGDDMRQASRPAKSKKSAPSTGNVGFKSALSKQQGRANFIAALNRANCS
jgi:hypothetical protein